MYVVVRHNTVCMCRLLTRGASVYFRVFCFLPIMKGKDWKKIFAIDTQSSESNEICEGFQIELTERALASHSAKLSLATSI